MKGKHLAILLLLVLLIGGAGWYFQKSNRAAWSETSASTGGKVVNLPLNDVAHVVIKTSTAELNLVKKDDAWTVQERAGYPASFDQVSELLRKIWDLKTVQEVKVGPSQFARLDLVEPGKGENSGTLADFKDKDGKSLTSLLLGKKYMRKSEGMGGEGGGFPAGRYVLPVGGTKVSLVSEALEDVDPKPERWLKKDFIKVDGPKSITLTGQTEPMHWKVTRESATGDWKLADAKPEETLDTGKTSSFGSIFSSPSFNDILAPDAKPAETGLDKPTTAVIETFDNFAYTLKIGKAMGENYPVMVSVSAQLPKERVAGKDEKAEDKKKLDEEFQSTQKRLESKLQTEQKFAARAYLVAKYTVEPLMKDRSALLAEKKPDPSAPSGNPLPGVGAPGGLPSGTPPPTGAGMPPGHPPISATTPPISLTSPPPASPKPPTTPPPSNIPPSGKPPTPASPPPGTSGGAGAPSAPSGPGNSSPNSDSTASPATPPTAPAPPAKAPAPLSGTDSTPPPPSQSANPSAAPTSGPPEAKTPVSGAPSSAPASPGTPPPTPAPPSDSAK